MSYHRRDAEARRKLTAEDAVDAEEEFTGAPFRRAERLSFSAFSALSAVDVLFSSVPLRLCGSPPYGADA